jgi:hypothetical protein
MMERKKLRKCKIKQTANNYIKFFNDIKQGTLTHTHIYIQTTRKKKILYIQKMRAS